MVRLQRVLLFLLVFFSAGATAFTRPTVSTLSREPHTFLVTDHGIPVADQADSWSCLSFASTSLIEYLIHQATGQHSFLDEWWLLPYARGSDDTFNEYTDEPFALAAAITSTGAYAPPINRTVLFSRGFDASGTWNPWGPGGMSETELSQMKSALVSYGTPVLFVYKDPSVTYWHANLCLGYDDAARELICRDSLLGQTMKYGGRLYRNVNRVPYSLALASGKHASVWYLAARTPDWIIPKVPLTLDFPASSYPLTRSFPRPNP